MAREITVAEVDQAEAALAAAKKGKDVEKRQAAMDALAEVRSAFRLQEEQAGRRVGLVGGDATPEG
jgi:hypothetical protein